MKIEFKNVNFGWAEDDYIFENLSYSMPNGITTLVGQNGCGKTTMMLLASGRILPHAGTIEINGIDTQSLDNEEERNKLASFLYQNMEFETEESIAELLTMVSEAGTLGNNSDRYRKELIESLNLKNLLDKQLHKTSKGEMQRVLVAFSVLYGSPNLFMDEPFFAMEESERESALEYLSHYVNEDKNRSIYFSIHELHLSRKYAQNTILFTKAGTIDIGSVDEILTKEKVENAYQTPIDLLYEKEHNYIDRLRNPTRLQEGMIKGQEIS